MNEKKEINEKEAVDDLFLEKIDGCLQLLNQSQSKSSQIEKKMKKSFDKVKKHYLTQSNVGKGFDD